MTMKERIAAKLDAGPRARQGSTSSTNRIATRAMPARARAGKRITAFISSAKASPARAGCSVIAWSMPCSPTNSRRASTRSRCRRSRPARHERLAPGAGLRALRFRTDRGRGAHRRVARGLRRALAGAADVERHFAPLAAFVLAICFTAILALTRAGRPPPRRRSRCCWRRPPSWSSVWRRGGDSPPRGAPASPKSRRFAALAASFSASTRPASPSPAGRAPSSPAGRAPSSPAGRAPSSPAGWRRRAGISPIVSRRGRRRPHLSLAALGPAGDRADPRLRRR